MGNGSIMCPRVPIFYANNLRKTFVEELIFLKAINVGQRNINRDVLLHRRFSDNLFYQ